jgi:hypothetical protein
MELACRLPGLALNRHNARTWQRPLSALKPNYALTLRACEPCAKWPVPGVEVPYGWTAWRFGAELRTSHSISMTIAGVTNAI